MMAVRTSGSPKSPLGRAQRPDGRCARMSITVPMVLRRAMENHPHINWSHVASKAFLEECEQLAGAIGRELRNQP